jgi:hypothetical protein
MASLKQEDIDHVKSKVKEIGFDAHFESARKITIIKAKQ